MVASLLGHWTAVYTSQGLAHFDSFDIPNLLSILFDGSVTAKLASPESIHDGHAVPPGLVGVGFVNFFLSLDVGLEICRNKVPIVVIGDSADQAHEKIFFSKGTDSDGLNRLLQFWRHVFFRTGL